MQRTTLAALVALAACTGSDEAVPVELEVAVSDRGLAAAVTDLDYEVTVTEARVAVADLLLSVEGEEHEPGLLGRLHDALVPSAHAHPGHAAGGEVTGELLGDFVLDFADDGAPVGTATLLTGDYQSANFRFRRATELDASDPLSGHTSVLSGTARRGGDSWQFSAVVDVDAGVELTGAPFQLAVRPDTAARLHVQLNVTDPIEGDTAFDGIDFGALDDDADGSVEITPGDADENRLRRALTSHDHYLIDTSSTERTR